LCIGKLGRADQNHFRHRALRRYAAHNHGGYSPKACNAERVFKMNYFPARAHGHGRSSSNLQAAT
jgi:hypothetical protein